jgi:hypothetical protein
MVRMNDDEKFDAWLRDAAQSYNAPPANVPRDEMWSAIQQASASQRMPATWRTHKLLRWAPAAAAAVLLLAVGYSAGRFGRSPPATTPAVAEAPATTPDTVNGVYDAKLVSHFGRAEALLTSFRAATPDGDAALNSWARDLLTDTRLLLDSPAGADARRRRLLEDLELTLAQIVQLPAASSPDDQELLDRAIERGELLTRLRTAVPPRVSGT